MSILPRRWSGDSRTGLTGGGDKRKTVVFGTTQLFEDGKMRYIPTPSQDPKDPLNLPTWRKWVAVASLCFFGALALSAEVIIGALVPVFVLEYAGIDPKILAQVDISALNPPGGVNLNPLELLASFGGPPIEKVALLSSIPLLVNGIASYFLVPVSIGIGRRPVLLFAGACAWAGGLWAGFSQDLNTHIIARCFQGLGAGAVEALIPLIVQDFMFIHERNRAIATIGASQGLIIVSLGIASPIIVARYTWRYIYYITSGVGILAWAMLIAFVPETRWIRTKDELAGKQIHPLEPGETRTRLDPGTYGERTFWTEIGIFNVSREWKGAIRSVWDTIRTTVFPNVFWVVVVNSIFVSVQGAAGQVGSSVLIAAGWQFETLGFAVIPVVVASPFVWLFGGFVADKISNFIAKRNGGKREPEAHLISLIIPLIAGILGPFVFGYAAENINKLPSIVVLIAVFLIGFGLLTANTIFSVYLIESYPQFAGPVLVNVSSSRLIVGFATSFDVTRWIQDIGFFKTFGLYSLALTVACLFLPLVYIYGKRIRAWTSGRLEVGGSNKEKELDDADWSTDMDDKREYRIVHLGPTDPVDGMRMEMSQQPQKMAPGNGATKHKRDTKRQEDLIDSNPESFKALKDAISSPSPFTNAEPFSQLSDQGLSSIRNIVVVGSVPIPAPIRTTGFKEVGKHYHNSTTAAAGGGPPAKSAAPQTRLLSTTPRAPNCRQTPRSAKTHGSEPRSSLIDEAVAEVIPGPTLKSLYSSPPERPEPTADRKMSEKRPTLMRPPPVDENKAPIENVLDVTELGVLGPDIFTNTRQPWHPPGARGIFGGAMIAQCLAAGQKTVPENFFVHSCHCYFLLAGSSEVPILFHVERVRDGRSFATRTVQARQKGKCIFTVTMSFVRSDGAGDKEGKRKRRAGGGAAAGEVSHSSVFPEEEKPPTEAEMREVERDDLLSSGPFQSHKIRIIGSGAPETLKTRGWVRARGEIRGGTTAHLEALAYMSDSYFIGTVARIHSIWRWPFSPTEIPGLPKKWQDQVRKVLEFEDIATLGGGGGGRDGNGLERGEGEEAWTEEQLSELKELDKRPKLGMMVSLDHAIYFHEPERVRADRWMMCEMESPWAGDGRGVVLQRIFDEEGVLVATCVQEGVVRLREEGKEEGQGKAKL
ncbi:hypothetical protein MKZ38_001260 [Zalerion maritima]|uniref:Major facilitator superfamily (MFS) profile domain-containing protein n=1 Tax=Zalerion maritima TaxID=339359 RepID=A0AAD5WTY5_9PEZI|nr:hypothetical protein MKZ38_001260 [Zalerion maritima]